MSVAPMPDPFYVQTEPVVCLHQFGRWAFGPNPSPPCIAVETFLRVAGVPHKVDGDFQKNPSPSGLIPWISFTKPDDKRTVHDSLDIIKTLKAELKITMDDKLTKQQVAVGTQFLRLLSQSTYFACARRRWVDNFDLFFPAMQLNAPVPTCILKMALKSKRKDIIESLNRHGNGERTTEQYIEDAISELDSIETLMASDGSGLVFGSAVGITSYDCYVFAFVHSFTTFEYGCEEPIKTFILTQCPKLKQLEETIRTKYFPDIERMTNPKDRPAIETWTPSKGAVA